MEKPTTGREMLLLDQDRRERERLYRRYGPPSPAEISEARAAADWVRREMAAKRWPFDRSP